MKSSKLTIFIFCMFLILMPVAFAGFWDSMFNWVNVFSYPAFALSAALNRNEDDIQKQYIMLKEYYCDENKYVSLPEDLFWQMRKTCNIFQVNKWNEINTSMLDYYEQYMKGDFSSGAITTLNMEAELSYDLKSNMTIGQVSAYEQYLITFNQEKRLSLNNMSYIWYSLGLIFYLVVSLLKIVYYLFEVMFLAWVFLDFIPRRILDFRDMLVKYFIGRL